MEAEAPSQTSVNVAMARALHQAVDDKPLILDDPIAPMIVDTQGEAYARLFEARDQPDKRLGRTIMVVRSRYAEDCLADAVLNGARQYLILGAGMDTFAYRQPPWAWGLRMFEVDHPSTQTFKRARLDAAGIAPPPNLTFVPVDFETGSLDHALRQSGFDFATPTFCAWLGVTMYLTDEAIDETLTILRGLPSGSQVVLSFNLPPEALLAADAERVRSLMEGVAASGEPWLSLYRPNEMIAKLLGFGFSQAIHFSPEAANERYCRDRRDGLRMPKHLHLMRAVV
jgi:methyltransferase (TIGR00027 family)